MRKKILLTGASGGLGKILRSNFEKDFTVVGITRKSYDKLIPCDLCDFSKVENVVSVIKPDIILHAAALADVDACQKNPAVAWEQNVGTTKNIVRAAQKLPTKPLFVFISTDQVYSLPGHSSEAQTSILNVYAQNKFDAEMVAMQQQRCLTLRVNFFGQANAEKKTIVDWLQIAASKKTKSLLFQNVKFNPLHVEHLSKAIMQLVKDDLTGLFNLGGSGAGISKSRFFREICRKFNIPTENFVDGNIEEAGLYAPRPLDMRMDISHLIEKTGLTPPSTIDGIEFLTAKENQFEEQSKL